MLVNRNHKVLFPPCQPALRPTVWDGITALSALVLALLLLFSPASPAGEVCVITWDEGQATLPLQTPEVLTIDSREISLTITVSDGGVSVTEAGCPDGVCRNSGVIRHVGEIIVCVPAGVVIRVPGETAEDFVVG